MKETNIFTDTIDNRDTLFTIDQYQTFNLDFEYESQIDYLQSDDSKELRESEGLPDFDDETYLVDDYLDFSFDPDNSYHEALASAALILSKKRMANTEIVSKYLSRSDWKVSSLRNSIITLRIASS
jgi:hypothetical protein